jgi:hypothetical protein
MAHVLAAEDVERAVIVVIQALFHRDKPERKCLDMNDRQGKEPRKQTATNRSAAEYRIKKVKKPGRRW